MPCRVYLVVIWSNAAKYAERYLRCGLSYLSLHCWTGRGCICPKSLFNKPSLQHDLLSGSSASELASGQVARDIGTTVPLLVRNDRFVPLN